MTHKEALNKVKGYLTDIIPAEDYSEVEEIMKALEQEPSGNLISRQVIIDTVHKTIYQFFDVCDDDEEVPMSDKNKFLLEVNKAICNNLKALEQSSTDAVSRQDAYKCLEIHGDYNTLNEVYERLEKLPPVNPQEPSITWVTGADGAKIAFKDVPVWKVTKICEILGESQERSEDDL